MVFQLVPICFSAVGCSELSKMDSASVSSNSPLSVPFDGVSACSLPCIFSIPSGGRSPGPGGCLC